jgi:hypothetical protein
VLATAAHAYLAKLLYARAPQVPLGSLHTVTEMEQAAQWMYYGGDIAERSSSPPPCSRPGTGSEAAANPATRTPTRRSDITDPGRSSAHSAEALIGAPSVLGAYAVRDPLGKTAWLELDHRLAAAHPTQGDLFT